MIRAQATLRKKPGLAATLAASFLALSACTDIPVPADTPSVAKMQTVPAMVAQTTDVNRFAIRVLDSIQARSIAEGREYCGLIFQDPKGQLRTSRILPGGEDFCEIPVMSGTAVASFHTHGSYSPAYDNEVPSVQDALSDFEAGTDGYVSTPGGRVWLVDNETRTINQLCGLGCVTSDPRNDPRSGPPVPPGFSFAQLRARQSEARSTR